MSSTKQITAAAAMLAALAVTAPPANAAVNGSPDFDGSPVGRTTTKVITYTNDYGTLIAINAIVEGDAAFALVSTTCVRFLGAGGTCSATVRFTPTAVGPVAGEVVFWA